MNAARENVTGDFLRGFRGQLVIEKPGFHAVASDGAEHQVEVIIEAVRRNGGIPHREVLLVHFEGRGQMLCLADHRDGDVPDENRSGQGAGSVPGAKGIAHGFGRFPGAGGHESLQSVCTDRGGIGLDLRPAMRIGICIYYNGETLCMQQGGTP